VYDPSNKKYIWGPKIKYSLSKEIRDTEELEINAFLLIEKNLGEYLKIYYNGPMASSSSLIYNGSMAICCKKRILLHTPNLLLLPKSCEVNTID
jgi:hypothetical protein